MKKLMSILLVLAMVLSMAACGSKTAETTAPAAEGGEKTVKIGLSIAGMTMPYYVRMYEGFLAAAEKEGYEVTFADGGSDA